MAVIIETPRGQIILNENQRARLVWNPGFGREYTQKFDILQKYVDSEVVRRSDPYVPFRTGILKKSGILGTVIGSGTVQYIALHARKNYYHNKGRGTQGTASGGKRGKLWFERMKADHCNSILRGAGGKLR